MGVCEYTAGEADGSNKILVLILIGTVVIDILCVVADITPVVESLVVVRLIGLIPEPVFAAAGLGDFNSATGTVTPTTNARTSTTASARTKLNMNVLLVQLHFPGGRTFSNVRSSSSTSSSKDARRGIPALYDILQLDGRVAGTSKRYDIKMRFQNVQH